MRQYLEFIADQRLVMLGLQKVYGVKNPFSFMDLQDVQELANFFESPRLSLSGRGGW